MRPSARRWRRRRAPAAACGVAGVAHRIARQAVAGEGLRGDRGRAAARHEGLAEAERAQEPRQYAAATFGDCAPCTMATIGLVATRRAEGQPALVSLGAERDRAAHRMAEREMRLRHVGLEHLIADRLEVAPVIGRNCGRGPCAAFGTLPARQALAAPVEGDDGKAAVERVRRSTSKYFSMNSARPWRMQTVPRSAPPSSAASARRAASRRPSVLTAIDVRVRAGSGCRGWREVAARRPGSAAKVELRLFIARPFLTDRDAWPAKRS